MPTMPCQGLTFERPNRIWFIHEGDRNRDYPDIPGTFLPFDDTIVHRAKESARDMKMSEREYRAAMEKELITDVHDTPESVIRQLEDVHRYVYQCMDDELLWVSSMPCKLPPDAEIPVGRYGTSNVAQAKTIYRLGLGNRYGRFMQTISGIHYNFSVADGFWATLAGAVGARPTQDFKTQSYFSLIRNFRRFSWLLIYLFGASPALCRSFVKDKPHQLEAFDDASLYLPEATSLRMGRLGYQSDAQSQLHISYNSLDQYARSMQQALTQPYPAYEQIGVKVNGEYRQLSDTLLQIENEFYGTIRPKRPVQDEERPLAALRRRGVEYVEVRCLDLNPFLRVGIDEQQIRFIDAFLLYCLLADSPADSEKESALMSANQLTVVERGREPGLILNKTSGPVTREAWSREILEGCRPLAEMLDRAHGGDKWGNAKSNFDFRRAVAAAMGCRVDQLPTAIRRISTPSKSRGSVWYGMRLMNQLAAAGRLHVHPRCSGFTEAAFNWRGDSRDPLKDRLDSGRYIIERLFEDRQLWRGVDHLRAGITTG
jgi:glutamate--cysteine ligase